MRTNTYAVNPGWRVLLSDVGISPVSVLKRAQLPEDLFVRDKASLTTAQYFKLWEALVSESGDPLFPLKVGEAISTESFDAPIFAAMCSPNLNVALSRIAKFKPLIAPMHLDINQSACDTHMTLEWLDKTAEPPASLLAMELVFFVQLARMGTRTRICPSAVTAPVRLSPEDTYTDWFGITISLGKSASISFKRDDAARPFLTANEPIWATFEPELNRTLVKLTQSPSMTDRVKASLLELIPSGLVSMGAVAKKLGTSIRSMQRHLQQEETRFQIVLASTREQLARHYLERSTLSGAEIAFLLGFDDPNSFFRAFRNWTGVTPDQVRSARN
ncbi:MAG: AraC family transcriptional regulator ligand-binding domain-containing protein [Acidobacteria bacterium]|nr:AraC family transcriptional regulator ligand-binding domain-containing protein [Acidobacteriota bacterium]